MIKNLYDDTKTATELAIKTAQDNFLGAQIHGTELGKKSEIIYYLIVKIYHK